MTNVVYIACSLDGFIARKDGSIDWLTDLPNPDQSDYGFSDFIDGIDGIVMGRGTFETVLAFGSWPYTRPVFVWSHSMKKVPAHLEGKAELIRGKAQDIVETLANRGMKRLYIDGGKTIQSFLKVDLIDEMILTRIPIILGSGIPLFVENDQEIRFELIRSEVLGGNLVKNHYSRIQ